MLSKSWLCLRHGFALPVPSGKKKQRQLLSKPRMRATEPMEAKDEGPRKEIFKAAPKTKGIFCV